MKRKKASSTLYVIFFLIMFLLFAAFAVDCTIVFTTRAKLQNSTETAALAGASEFNYSSTASTSDIEQKVKTTAESTFAFLKIDGLNNASIEVSVKSTPTKKVLVKTEMVAQPYFLAFLGITGIDLKAQACAISEELPVQSSYAGINWLTSSAAYRSDIISKDSSFNDTAILSPVGDFSSASYTNNFVDFNYINSSDNKPISLGPGGFITIKLPAPIIDKTGYDLSITELGVAEGYMIFAGLDVNPESPYVQVGNEGSGIAWVNISCSGKSDTINNATESRATPNLGGSQTIFYGSGKFDLSDSCITGAPFDISMAKYIRIIDDNQEKANISGTTKWIYGEASTATSGADIDAVTVLNHVKLIAPSSFST